MKITKTKLKQIIKEEIEQLARGRSNISLSRGQTQNIRQTQDRAKKIIRLLSSTDPDDVEQGLTILDALGDQQLIDTIASYFVFDSKSNSITTRRGFNLPQELGMILNYFAEKSDRVKNMLAQIESLDITDGFITNVDFLRFCTNLTKLDLGFCESLQNVDGLKGCTNLMSLDLGGCRSLENVDVLKECTNLTWLSLAGCESLQNVDGLVGCTNLMRLDLSECTSLENVDGLVGCTNLTKLYLSYCKSLQNVDGLKGCTNLMVLYLSFCESLQNVDALEGCTNLDWLILEWCTSLENVDALEGCTNLDWLNLWRCKLLSPELQRSFRTDNSGTAYEQFMEALNAS